MLLRILVGEGEVPVGRPVAVIGEAGEEVEVPVEAPDPDRAAVPRAGSADTSVQTLP